VEASASAAPSGSEDPTRAASPSSPLAVSIPPALEVPSIQAPPGTPTSQPPLTPQSPLSPRPGDQENGIGKFFRGLFKKDSSRPTTPTPEQKRDEDSKDKKDDELPVTPNGGADRRIRFAEGGDEREDGAPRQIGKIDPNKAFLFERLGNPQSSESPRIPESGEVRGILKDTSARNSLNLSKEGSLRFGSTAGPSASGEWTGSTMKSISEKSPKKIKPEKQTFWQSAPSVVSSSAFSASTAMSKSERPHSPERMYSRSSVAENRAREQMEDELNNTREERDRAEEIAQEEKLLRAKLTYALEAERKDRVAVDEILRLKTQDTEYAMKNMNEEHERRMKTEVNLNKAYEENNMLKEKLLSSETERQHQQVSLKKAYDDIDILNNRLRNLEMERDKIAEDLKREKSDHTNTRADLDSERVERAQVRIRLITTEKEKARVEQDMQLLACHTAKVEESLGNEMEEKTRLALELASERKLNGRLDQKLSLALREKKKFADELYREKKRRLVTEQHLEREKLDQRKLRTDLAIQRWERNRDKKERSGVKVDWSSRPTFDSDFFETSALQISEVRQALSEEERATMEEEERVRMEASADLEEDMATWVARRQKEMESEKQGKDMGADLPLTPKVPSTMTA